MDSVGLTYGVGAFEAGVAYHRTNCAEGSDCPIGKGKDEIARVGA